MHLSRLLHILRVAGRYRVDELVDKERLPRTLRWALSLSPWHQKAPSDKSRGERLRLTLQELGPVFIKFGQMLSTRRDLLPPDIADELAKLQDQVPPFCEDEAVALIEQHLSKPIDELFASFNRAPLASASVAQVHEATLPGGESVVVKVVRPDIEPVIRQDMALLYFLARLLRRFVADGWRLRPVEVVKDYELTILDELDLSREAANAAQLRRNFLDSDLVYVPQVYWDYTCHKVYTMERISGIPVSDMAALKARKVDLKVLAEKGVTTFFTQVFRDSFFHADMHPGNIFVDASDPANPSYIAVDCAIVGSLSEFDQYYLARNLLAIFQRDYRQVAQLHVECGWVPPETRVQDFESAMRAVCEPVFEQPLAKISFGQLLIYLFNTARRFDMEVQPSLVLLQKTLLNIEGLGRQLYPDLNLWDTAQPFLEDWVGQRYSPQGLLERLQRQAPSWMEQLP
ncbi:MAG: ubiquinone biosynthesis regulatory protein kinase UbiB, partial [Gammaproteobacteria bacterium]